MSPMTHSPPGAAAGVSVTNGAEELRLLCRCRRGAPLRPEGALGAVLPGQGLTFSALLWALVPPL